MGKPKQHHCEIVRGALTDPSALAREVERAYQVLNEEALREDMVILVTTQTTEAYSFMGEPCLAVIVTAQRILRTDLEDAQRRAQLMGMHPPQVGRG